MNLTTADNNKTYLWHVYKNAMQAHIDNIWGWDLVWQQNDFDKSLSKYNTYIVQEDRKNIGYIQYGIDGKHGYINMLILEPKQQSQGLGKILLNKFITDNKLTKLSLRCFKVNTRALNFYKRERFQVEDEDKEFYFLSKIIC